jgi:long-chain acyl-CoA synthetase
VDLEPFVAAARTVARLSKQVEVAAAEAGLSLPQYRLLTYLSEGGAPASILAGRLRVSRPSITALVDGLVSRGLVERGPDPADRRRVQHRLTAAGRNVAAAADRALAERLSGLLEGLPSPDREEALAGLRHWTLALNRALEARLASEGRRGGARRAS